MTNQPYVTLSSDAEPHAFPEPVDPRAARLGARTRGRFYVGFASLLLLLVLAGFGPSFFLRPLFDFFEPLPVVTVTHGVVLTAWYVLFLVQAALATRGEMRLHRALGAAGAVVAVVATLGFLWLALDLFLARPPDVDAALVERARHVRIVRELAVFLAFPTLVGLGVWFRRDRSAHKRLMLLATLALIPPALARLAVWPGRVWPALDVVPQIPALLASFALLLGAAVVHDVIARGRPHPVLGWGAPGLFVWQIGTGLVVPAVLM